jgi:hypothetical protein
LEFQNEHRRFTFNKIYVIESLPDSETQTGMSLYQDLLKWSNNLREDICSEYWGVNTKRQFELCLEAIYIDTVFGCDPFVHFEIHGSSNFDGLVLKSNELITWSELAEMTRKVNQSVRNNLVISFATCYSGYFVKAIDITKTSPFHGCVMTTELLTISEIEIRFNSFFQSLLSSLDFDLAIQNLNEVNGLEWKLLFFSSEEAFDVLFQRLINESLLVNSGGKSWLEEAIAKHLNSEGFSSDSIDTGDEEQVKNMALSLLIEIESKYKSEFLLTDEQKSFFAVKVFEIIGASAAAPASSIPPLKSSTFRQFSPPKAPTIPSSGPFMSFIFS